MRGTRETGKTGEEIAHHYLEKQGYKFLAANWLCKAGELDLVMYDPDDDCRVIVEVRLRQPTTFGEGDETVAYQKQKKLLRTAAWYQQKEKYWGNLRFDVVSIELTLPDGIPNITHIPDAFGA